jgi:hypothetical protein
MLTHNCTFNGNAASTIRNDFSFPTGSIVRFRYPARGQRPAIDLVWYEGGIRPTTPEELDEDHKELPAEGMMFVGDKGKILAGFHVDSPRLIPERKMQGRVAPPPPPRPNGEFKGLSDGLKQWAQACRGGAQSPGNFGNAWPISEAVNLYAAALRTGKRLLYDAESRKVTNVSEANRYLARDYRKGFEI